MNKKTHGGIFPNCRFKGFYGEWEIKELNELGNLINGLTYSPSDVREKGLLVLRSSNIQNGIIDLKDCVYVRTDIKGANLSKPNDILVCVRNGSKDLIGKNTLIPRDIPLATHGAFMTVFRTNSSGFVFQLFQTDLYDIQVKADLGATINSINGKNFLKYKFPFPKKTKEQQKIAECLSSIDETIRLEKEKLDQFKEHKKGLLNGLFPNDDTNAPKYLFSIFKKRSKWQQTLLGDCLTQEPDYGVNAPAVPFSNNLPTYIRITDISENGHYDPKDKVSVDRMITENDYLADGDIVLARTGASVGKSYKHVKENGKLVFAGFLIRVKTDKTKLSSDFLFQYLSTNSYWKWVSFISARSGQPGINATEYASMPIYLPYSVKEQERIASCLSALDDLITAQTEKIELLGQHKKGLMQGLFPKLID